MLPRAEILAWRAEYAPWIDEDDVEQDLVLTRALCDIFSDDFLRQRLAFRGGTALHKLHLAPAARYSDDLDLVQRSPEGIGATLDRLRAVLAWLGHPHSETRDHPKLIFRFETESTRQTRRLKIEINSREHFGQVVDRPVTVVSSPLTAAVSIPTYSLDELLATKLRALYQRRKGRDLFDVWHANAHAQISPPEIVRLLDMYMLRAGFEVPTRVEFARNLSGKQASGVLDEVRPLLRPGIHYDASVALSWFMATFLPLFDA